MFSILSFLRRSLFIVQNRNLRSFKIQSEGMYQKLQITMVYNFTNNFRSFAISIPKFINSISRSTIYKSRDHRPEARRRT